MSGPIGEIVRALVDAGATGEMILAAVDAAERRAILADEDRKEKGRARMRKWRAKKEAENDDVTVTSRNVTSQSATQPLARVEDSSSKEVDTGFSSKENTPSSRKPAVGDLAEFKTVLAPHLDSERIEALVKHRRTKKGQNTGHAARLFLKDAAACGMSPIEAADTCISRNWITVKPEYFAGRRPNGQGPPQSMSAKLSAAAVKDIEEIVNDYDAQHTHRGDARNAGRNQEVIASAVRAISVVGR